MFCVGGRDWDFRWELCCCCCFLLVSWASDHRTLRAFLGLFWESCISCHIAPSASHSLSLPLSFPTGNQFLLLESLLIIPCSGTAVGEAGPRVRNGRIHRVYSWLGSVPPPQCLVFVLPLQPWRCLFLPCTKAFLLSFSFNLCRIPFGFVPVFPGKGTCPSMCMGITLHISSTAVPAVKATWAPHCAPDVGQWVKTEVPMHQVSLGEPWNSRFLWLILFSFLELSWETPWSCQPFLEGHF